MPNRLQPVVSHPSEPPASGGKSHEGLLSTPSSIFEACRRRVSRFLGNWLDELFSYAGHDLFAGAHGAPSNNAACDSFDAMQELHRLKSPIRNAFVGDILDALDRLWNADIETEDRSQTAPEEFHAEQMSLVDTQNMEDEVAVVTIAARAAAALRAGEHALAHGLSQILPVPLDADSNPLGARSICITFHQALQNLGAERASRRALFQTLDETIIRELSKLHQELNDFLIEQGISARRRYIARNTVTARRSGVQAPAGEQELPTSASSAARRSDSGTAAETSSVSSAVLPPSIAPWGPSSDPTVALPFADACKSAWHLMRLERVDSSGAPVSSRHQVSETDPDERRAIETALAQVQHSGEASRWGEKGPYAFGVRVRAALAKHGVKINDPAIDDTLDVVATLLDNILADPIVQNGVKPLIRQLGLPLCRVALGDATFLASDSHPARETINQLGHLAIPSEGDEGKDGAFSADEVRGVVGRVVGAPRANREIFSRSAEELTALLKRQRGCFEQGVKGLLENTNRHQAALGQQQVTVNGEKLPLSTAELVNGDWQRALESVSRLEIGEVVVLAAASLTPAPATLVWRRADGEVMVFADAWGRRAAIFGRRELAMALHRGTVRLDEVAGMPIVDRAMCRVLQDLHRKLEHKANRDSLTGLANREIFEVDVARAMKSATSGQRRHHVCYVGLSHLPAITKRFGDKAAKALLKRYAPVLDRQIADKGLVAHLGQGRFAILLANTTRGEVLQLMERHRRSIEFAKCVYRGEVIELAVSIGVVAVTPEVTDPAAIVEAASIAYTRASSGSPMGLHVQEAPAGSQPEASGAIGMADVSELIAAGRLTLRCQRVAPVDPHNGLRPYYEVLLGVRDGSGRVEPPGSVIAAAERTGKISEIDRWVVAEALRWMARHYPKLESLSGLAINLSGATLSDPKLARFVAEQLEASSVPPERIRFEVTESSAIERLSAARDFIESLQALGCRFAIDDFGAGHASFSYLKFLPVDTVKIDGLFVKDIVSNPADEAMVRSINEIAKLFGKRTVAEFVQDDKALARLHQIGVDYAQGFGIEKPIPIDELISGHGIADNIHSTESARILLGT
jgi:diguanylate cyclase (GGDEF)-like protein